MRAAFAHVLADAAGSVAALVAGLLVFWFGWALADPVASILISLMILVGAWRLIRDSLNVLMEGAPSSIETSQLERLIRETPGVAGLHDLHVWSVSDGFPLVTVHVTLVSGHHGTDVAKGVSKRIEKRLGVIHMTVQPEPPPPSLVPPSALPGEGRRSRSDQDPR